MGRPHEMMVKHDMAASWLMRFIIIALLGWAGTTLLSVDTRLTLVEYRITLIEGHHNNE